MASSTSVADLSAGQNAQNGGDNAEAFQTQLRFSTTVMADLEELRKENERLKKQRDFYKLQFDSANEKMVYLKKKVNKENTDPNANNDDDNE